MNRLDDFLTRLPPLGGLALRREDDWLIYSRKATGAPARGLWKPGAEGAEVFEIPRAVVDPEDEHAAALRMHASAQWAHGTDADPWAPPSCEAVAASMGERTVRVRNLLATISVLRRADTLALHAQLGTVPSSLSPARRRLLNSLAETWTRRHRMVVFTQPGGTLHAQVDLSHCPVVLLDSLVQQAAAQLHRAITHTLELVHVLVDLEIELFASLSTVEEETETKEANGGVYGRHH